MKEITTIDQACNIEKILNSSISFLEKGYLDNRGNYEIVPIPSEYSSLSYSTGIRMIHLTKFTYEEEENILDKLSNVFTALYGNKTSIFLILKSDGEKCNFYLGVRDDKSITQSISTLKSSLSGNFPGVLFEDNIETSHIENIVNYILRDKIMEISTVTGVPSLKSDDKEKFLQGIERVINGMEGKEFSAIFIGNPIEYSEIKRIKNAYENMYSSLFPYVDLNISLNKSEAMALGKNNSETFTKNYSQNLSETDTTNKSFTSGTNSSTSTSYSGNATLLGTGVGFLLGGPIGAVIGTTIGAGLGSLSKTNSHGKNRSETYGSSHSQTMGETYGESNSYQTGINETKTDTVGKTLQLNQKNKTLENLTKKIDKHLERLELAEGNGFWNIGTYFLSSDPQNSVVAANIYNGIIRGKDSGVEKNGVYTFNKHSDLEIIKDYLYNFSNPILKVKTEENDIYTTIGSLVTNDELALKLNFPQTSVGGLDVIKMAAFGRNQNKNLNEKKIDIGKLYYLGKSYKSEINLDLETLSSHTFVTGSTGAGKSNSVYCILDELYKNNIKFLVIEPAKGEYKNIFGGRENVSVYGTNIKHTDLLKVNPFSFNDNIHILEHIDRLTEIFNACWPMYAAMPAILKDAIEKSYVMVGWDLKESVNLYGVKKFPTFKQLKIALENVINNSSYSQENKGNYIGALVTRVNSLDNGLLGNIFDEEELSEKDLFDENVIIDISRIPSTETKSLVMGIVFMKLHEYRMCNHMSENSSLKHVTVLEEAHNLLKKTSTEQSSEGSNLQGKSVEMMTNAIAEMRTYGEGFIIADQAPGMLDPSVIRNTNTKICMRLPSLDDREIVGKSMNLNDNQIEELAKLETGVAAIIQSNWNEACLVKFNYMSNKSEYKYTYKNKKTDMLRNIMKVLLENKILESEKVSIEEKNKVIELLEKEDIYINKLDDTSIDTYIFNKIDGNKILNMVNILSSQDINEWNNKLQTIIRNILGFNNNENLVILEISNSIIRENTLKNPEYKEFYQEWNEFIRGGRIL